MLLYELPPHLQKFAETFGVVLVIIIAFLVIIFLVITLIAYILDLKDIIKNGENKK